MIDILGAVAAPASINRPLRINITDALFTERAPSALSFSQGDSFSQVFSDLLVLLERNGGETAPSVDLGFGYCESERESLIHLKKANPPYHFARRYAP
jgi:hypothetical protein